MAARRFTAGRHDGRVVAPVELVAHIVEATDAAASLAMYGAYTRSCVAFRDRRLQELEQDRFQQENSQNSRNAAAASANATTEPMLSQASSQRPSNGRRHHHPSTSTKKTSATTMKSGVPTKTAGRHPNAPSVRREQQQQRAAAEAKARSQTAKPAPPAAWNATVGTAAAAAATAKGSSITVPLTINLSMTQGEASQLTCSSSLFGNDGAGMAAAASATGGSSSKENVPPPHSPTLDLQGPGASLSSAAVVNLPLGQASVSSRSQETYPFVLRALNPLTKIPGAGAPSECIRLRFEQAEAQRQIKAKEEARRKAMEAKSHLSIVQYEMAVREAAAQEAAAREAASRQAAAFESVMNNTSSQPSLGRRHTEPSIDSPGWDGASLKPAAQPPALPGTDASPPEDSLAFDIDRALAIIAEERDKAADELKAATARALKTLEAHVAEAHQALAKEQVQEAQRLLDQVRDLSRLVHQDRRDLKEEIGAVEHLLDDARTTSRELRQDLVDQHSKASASLKDQLDRGIDTIRNLFKCKLGEIKRALFKDIVPFAEKYCGRWLEMYRQQESGRKHEKPRHGSSSSAPAVVQPSASETKRAQLAFTPPPIAASKGALRSPPASSSRAGPVKRTDRGSVETLKAREGAPTGSMAKASSSTHRTASTASNRKYDSSSPKMLASHNLTPIDRTLKLAVVKSTSSKKSVTGKSAIATGTKGHSKATPSAPAKRRPPVKRLRTTESGSSPRPHKKRSHFLPTASLDFPPFDGRSTA